MAKRRQEEDYEKSLTERFKRWDCLQKDGGHDPFWSDGVNMNLIRNHIIFYKMEIEKNMPESEYPSIYYRETPPETDSNYMAQPDRIRLQAAETLKQFEQDENLKLLKRKIQTLDQKFAKQISIANVIGYETALKMAIEKDNLIDMRRMGNAEMYLESFSDCVKRMQNYKPPVNAQISLFEMMDDEETFDIMM